MSDVRTCLLSFISLAVASTACDSPEKRAYKELAREINPILRDMQRTAAAVLDPAETEHHAVVVACSRVDDSIRALAAAKSGDVDSPIARHGNSTLQSEAKGLLDWRDPMCRRNTVIDEEVCSRFCRDWWRGLATQVEQLRTAAHALDVTLEPLYP